MNNHATTVTTVALYRRLFKAIAPYWILFVIGILGTTGNSGIDAMMAWLVKPVINKGFIARDEAFIRILPLAIVIIFIARGVTGFLSDYCITRVGRNVVMDFRQQVFAHFLKLPAAFYDQNSSGQLLSILIYNVEQIAQASTDALLIVVQEGCLAIGLIIVMFSVSWELTLLFVVTAPLMVLIFRYTSKRMRKVSSKVQETMGHVTHVAEETIEGYKVIRTFGGEHYEADKFNQATRLNRQREMKVIIADSLGTTGVQLLSSIVIAATLMLATSSVLKISAGSFAAMIAAAVALLRPVRRLTQVNNRIQKGLAGAQSVFALLDRPVEQDQGVIPLLRSQGNIAYQAVSFSYPNTTHQVLQDINLEINSGEVIALVGKSGSGKTTLVNLLPRFYDVTAGKILIDGVDIRDYKLADLRQQFALVSQHVTLFNDTIAHNIAYGRLGTVTEAEIKEAAKAAHAWEFIEHLPQQLNTLVGENGVLLSGGQRQRLAIARAILKNAPILILDEATSALDTESERHIQAALEDLMRHRTTLVIAHRLSTIENANRIVVMEQGKIIEMGTHQTLLQQQGAYARLHALQFRNDL